MKKPKFTIIPVPYEATVTYGKGTRKGPAAILKALPHVEEFDEEQKCEIFDIAEIQILKPVPLPGLEPRVNGLIKNGNIPVVLGGEHSITVRVIKAVAEKYKNLSVLQLDSHADLRDHYKGSKYNHACTMRRVLEICPAVQVGIRNISKWGYEYATKTGQIDKIHWAEKLELTEKIENQLSKNVYITIDVDVFDPSVIPATGTPEPGGMFWYEVLDVLKGVCATKNVVGFDVMELSPRKGEIASDFAAAKLVYKIMGFISTKS
ncbi:MAG: agmatinase [Candidatus Margulisiibacteriota bacterium]